ncbi:MAG: CAP domain-containing protein [Patescibacteria group bacterium]
MKIAHKIAHLLFPRESNNHKAKLLHNSSLMLLTLGLILYQSVLTFLPRLGPSVLGYAANISPDEVIRLVNEKRASAGLAPLTANPALAGAAQAKGVDMLNKDYWAHVSPDGVTPWQFFTDFGYKYRYAGENLARDFSSAGSAVDAWMASPSHRENMLSPKYKEIGIGVVEGDMAGVDTTIIVQFLGTKYTDTIPVSPVAEATTLPSPTSQAVVLATPSPAPERVLVSPFNTTKGVSLVTVGLLLGILTLDGILTSRRKIVRIGGRTFAHMAFLGMILAIAILLRVGQVI